jgi:hypothetical protein
VETDVTAQTFLVNGRGIVLVLLMLGMTTTAASGQTPLQNDLEISLLPGYTHKPLQGICNAVGEIVKKDGLRIEYSMGPIPQAGEAETSSCFVNFALQLPKEERLWLKELNSGGRKVHVVYGKDNILRISTTSMTEGVYFSATAKTPDEVADVLLMVLTLEKQNKPEDKSEVKSSGDKEPMPVKLPVQ